MRAGFALREGIRGEDIDPRDHYCRSDRHGETTKLPYRDIAFGGRLDGAQRARHQGIECAVPLEWRRRRLQPHLLRGFLQGIKRGIPLQPP